MKVVEEKLDIEKMLQAEDVFCTGTGSFSTYLRV